VITATSETVAICFIVSERLTRKKFSPDDEKSPDSRQYNASQYIP